MRLHQLDVVAFGPFADPVSVDFDALSDAGLFLLTGATGAGKTSVLDAVCFALYGAVPGDRQGAKRLRSDHAPPEVTPEVTLEFSVAGRRFRILRSPAWERPRKRGHGTTRAQAGVVLSERVAGSWTTLATRLDEAGHQVTGLLGMTLTQFCQVQLLPQGRFQAFLRAESDERHRLLQRLFRTSRFEDVEQWLRERRRQLRRESAGHHDVVADVISRVSEASGQPLPDHWDAHALGEAGPELLPWAAGVRDAAVTDASRCAATLREAASAEATSSAELARARTVTERQDRHLRALARHEALAADEVAHRARSRALDAARRAAQVLPACEEAERSLAEAVAAGGAADSSLEVARDLTGRPDATIPTLAQDAESALASAAAARALRPRVEELAGLEQALSGLRAERSDAAEDLAGVDQRAEQLPAQITTSREAEAAAERADDQVSVTRDAVEEAAARLASGRLVDRLAGEKEAAQGRRRASVDHAQDAREHWLHVQELRLDGMAAEIAVALAVGDSCPVCGSADHPHPARPAPGAPDAAQERAARAAVDDAEAERLARTLAVSDLETRIEVARSRAGGRDLTTLVQEHASARELLAERERRAATLPALTLARRRLEEELTATTERRTTLHRDVARLDATISEHEGRIIVVDQELTAHLADSGHATVTSLASHLDHLAGVCRKAIQHHAAAEEATAAADTARERAARRCREAHLRSPAAARAAWLPSLLVDHLDHDVRDHEVALRAAETALHDPELRAAAALPRADLDELGEHHDRDEAAVAAARSAASLAQRAATRLRALVEELEAALDVWGPVEQSLALTDQLASLADGSSADNRLRMRLSAYVLAYRLSQVVDAANERLARMFDHRYCLEHSGNRGVGESRGGLSLRVRDDWTGESRDPATLSGGETFVVSLALALGLADVIAHEAGGSELDTLFVDEGFGTLDAETLDQVLDTLDSLRDGGRVVGVVSHVAEMQMRIPTQLHVLKQRAGSTLRQGH